MPRKRKSEQLQASPVTKGLIQGVRAYTVKNCGVCSSICEKVKAHATALSILYTEYDIDTDVLVAAEALGQAREHHDEINMVPFFIIDNKAGAYDLRTYTNFFTDYPV